MRKLAFRAWDKKLKKWVAGSKEGFNLFGECTLIGGILDDHYYTHNVFEKLYNDVEVMQWTGLKDKNGKEIYESDVVEAISIYDGKPIISEIVYQSGCFYLSGWKPLHTIGDTIDSDIIEVEVIGNVWENPELLK